MQQSNLRSSVSQAEETELDLGMAPGKTDQILGIVSAPQLSQIPYACDDAPHNPVLFPEGQLDADLQQVDLRSMNSWRMALAEVPTAELLE